MPHRGGKAKVCLRRLFHNHLLFPCSLCYCSCCWGTDVLVGHEVTKSSLYTRIADALSTRLEVLCDKRLYSCKLRCYYKNRRFWCWGIPNNACEEHWASGRRGVEAGRREAMWDAKIRDLLGGIPLGLLFTKRIKMMLLMLLECASIWLQVLLNTDLVLVRAWHTCKRGIPRWKYINLTYKGVVKANLGGGLRGWFSGGVTRNLFYCSLLFIIVMLTCIICSSKYHTPCSTMAW